MNNFEKPKKNRKTKLFKNKDIQFVFVFMKQKQIERKIIFQ
jgi:hypothetical protein